MADLACQRTGFLWALTSRPAGWASARPGGRPAADVEHMGTAPSSEQAEPPHVAENQSFTTEN